jgi:hemerythrin-like domain-containing protein
VKRSHALTPLSHDHHDALVAAQSLRRAADASEAAAAFLSFWRDHGSRHFRVEEEVLLPLWAHLGEVDERAAKRLAREHLRIRTMAIAVAEGASLETIHALGEELAAHVRFEERELFPAIEKALEPEALDRLGRAVRDAEQALA